MGFYYVCDNPTYTGTAAAGTDAGYSGTQRTGTVASYTAADFYPTVAAAEGALTTPTGGDFICIVNDHSETNAATNIFLRCTSTTVLGQPLVFIAVDPSNIENYLPATTVDNFITTGGARDISLNDSGVSNGTFIYVRGLNFLTSDDILCGSAKAFLIAEDCKLETSATNGICMNHTSYAESWFINCTFVGSPTATSTYFLYGQGIVKVYGGSVDLNGGSTNRDLISCANNIAGSHWFLHGVDLTGYSRSSYIFQGASNTSQYTQECLLEDCKLNANSLLGIAATNNKLNQTFTAINSSATSADREYQFFKQIGSFLTVEENTAVYRDNSFAFSDGSKASYHVVSSSNVSGANPVFFTLRPRYADLALAASDTLTIEMQSDDVLTDKDVYAVLRYPDGTNKHEQVQLSTRLADPIFGTGTGLTTSSEPWNGDVLGAGTSKDHQYKIVLDTSTGTAGAASAPYVDLYIAYDTGANPLYVCPKIDVS